MNSATAGDRWALSRLAGPVPSGGEAIGRRRPARRGSAARSGLSRGSSPAARVRCSRTRAGAASTICSKSSSTISTRLPSSAREMRSSSPASPLSTMPSEVCDRRQQQTRLRYALQEHEVGAVGKQVAGGHGRPRSRAGSCRSRPDRPASGRVPRHASTAPAPPQDPSHGRSSWWWRPEHEGPILRHPPSSPSVVPSNRDSSKRSASKVARSDTTRTTSSSASTNGR